MNLEIKTLDIQKRQWVLEHHFSEKAPFPMECQVDIHRNLLNELCMQIKAEVIQSRPAQRTMTFPKTWWDAFKIRWFPSWALRTWPATEIKVHLEAYALLPNLPVELGPINQIHYTTSERLTHPCRSSSR